MKTRRRDKAVALSPNQQLVGFDDLRSLGITYTRSHLYRLIAAGKFAKPIRLGENRVAFVKDEIDAWINERIAARRAAA